MNPDTTFSQPLIVYKINTEKAFIYALQVLEFLLLENIKIIYVEDLEKINLDILINYKFSNSQSLSREDSLENLRSIDKKIIKKFDKNENSVDLCIVIGGDGTTLWTSHLFGVKEKPPFLIFNLGSLGYMAIYSCEMINEVLSELFCNTKTMTFEKRATLEVKIYNKTTNIDPIVAYQGSALNDVILEKTNNSNLVNLEIYLNDEPLTVIRSDGIIISTSTGSTAYNLSAGGSVVHYDVDTLILNSICPHSLSFRSIALPRYFKLKFVPCCTSIGKVVVNTDCIERIVVGNNQYVEVSLSNNYCNFIVLGKFIKNRVSLWKDKIVNQLGWNNSFKNAS